MDLLKFMAKACHYAQEHIDDKDAWSVLPEDREQLLQCVSYQMACFLAQNTHRGDNGVEWDVLFPEIIEHPGKSEEEWSAILEKRAQLYGGWNFSSSLETSK